MLKQIQKTFELCGNPIIPGGNTKYIQSQNNPCVSNLICHAVGMEHKTAMYKQYVMGSEEQLGADVTV